MENWFTELDKTVEKLANNHKFQNDDVMVVFTNSISNGEKGTCKSVIYGNGLSVCATITSCAHNNPILCEIIETAYIQLVAMGQIKPDPKKYIKALQK